MLIGFSIEFGNRKMKIIIFATILIILLLVVSKLFSYSLLSILISLSIFTVLAIAGFFLYREMYKEDD